MDRVRPANYIHLYDYYRRPRFIWSFLMFFWIRNKSIKDERMSGVEKKWRTMPAHLMYTQPKTKEQKKKNRLEQRTRNTRYTERERNY